MGAGFGGFRGGSDINGGRSPSVAKPFTSLPARLRCEELNTIGRVRQAGMVVCRVTIVTDLAPRVSAT